MIKLLILSAIFVGYLLILHGSTDLPKAEISLSEISESPLIITSIPAIKPVKISGAVGISSIIPTSTTKPTTESQEFDKNIKELENKIKEIESKIQAIPSLSEVPSPLIIYVTPSSTPSLALPPPKPQILFPKIKKFTATRLTDDKNTEAFWYNAEYAHFEWATENVDRCFIGFKTDTIELSFKAFGVSLNGTLDKQPGVMDVEYNNENQTIKLYCESKEGFIAEAISMWVKYDPSPTPVP